MSKLNPYLLASGAQYKVTAAVAVVDSEHGEKYVYRGALLPADALPSAIEHLLAEGQIEKVGA